MPNTQMFYRKANVTRLAAAETLLKQFPDADVELTKKAATADEAAKVNGVVEGDLIYVATVKVSEFPPSDDSGSSEGGSEEKPEPKSEDAPPSDDEGDDAPPSDGPPAPGGEEGEHGKPKELKGEELTNHLLQQILDAVQGGGALAGPGADPLGGPDLPDVGAPGQGEGLPGPGPDKAPLPPPVPQKGPAAGMGAFASVTAGLNEFEFSRVDVRKDGLGHRALIREAMEMSPGFRVAKLDVTTLASEDTAIVKMVRDEA